MSDPLLGRPMQERICLNKQEPLTVAETWFEWCVNGGKMLAVVDRCGKDCASCVTAGVINAEDSSEIDVFMTRESEWHDIGNKSDSQWEAAFGTKIVGVRLKGMEQASVSTMAYILQEHRPVVHVWYNRWLPGPVCPFGVRLIKSAYHVCSNPCRHPWRKSSS